MMKKDWREISALVVGFGSIGRRHLRILMELGLTKLSVCDPSYECQEYADDHFGIENVYADLDDALSEFKPDTVFVCSPTALHIGQAMTSIESGADVLIEKPLSTSMDDVEELERIAERRKRIIMVAHCFRFHNGLLKAKSLVDEGRIGRVISVRASVGEYIPDVMPNYQNMYISKYNGVYELMHDIDLALWFAGQEPAGVMCMERSFSDVGMTSPDLVELLIEFEDRCVAHVHLDFFQRARRRQLEVLGTEGTLIVEFADWNSCSLSLYEASTSTWHIETMKTERDDMFRAEDKTFLESVISRGAVPVDIREASLAIKIINAAQESSNTGILKSMAD